MLIGIISDLHLDEEAPGAVSDALVETAGHAAIDLLVIPGDITSSWRSTLAALDDLESRLDCPLLFVPGNHDLWNREDKSGGPEAAEAALKAHPSCLSGRTVRVGAWNFVGETGWYDTSFAEGRFGAEALAAMSYGGRTWQDSLHAAWKVPMLARSEAYRASLESSLEGLDPRRTVAVTHVVPRLEFTVQPPEGIWTYFNALLGSAAIGELIARKGLRASLFGHVHHRRRAWLDGVEWICACLGTRMEWGSSDLARELDEAFAVFELED
jgi:putative phosphoesterase